jgi:hypothetical protein
VLSSGNFGEIHQEENTLGHILTANGFEDKFELTFDEFKSLLNKFIEDEKVMQSLTQA